MWEMFRPEGCGTQTARGPSAPPSIPVVSGRRDLFAVRLKRYASVSGMPTAEIEEWIALADEMDVEASTYCVPDAVHNLWRNELIGDFACDECGYAPWLNHAWMVDSCPECGAGMRWHRHYDRLLDELRRELTSRGS